MSITLSWIFLIEKITNTRKTEEKKHIRRECICVFASICFTCYFLLAKTFIETFNNQPNGYQFSHTLYKV